MKAFLFTTAMLLACVSGIYAQNQPPDYNWEVGVNAGLSTFTRPLGPANSYQGTKTNISHDYSIQGSFFFSPNWQITAQFGTRQWLSYGQWKQYDLLGQALSPRDVTFVVADHALTETIGMNYVIPFYTKYNTFNRSNLNFGVLFGLINTINDGSIAYSKYNSDPNPNLSYVSRYDYGYGIGTTWGIQMGYTYYIIPRFALNLDMSMRYASVRTTDNRYDHANDHFKTLYFPGTLGLRFRF